jgi:hypothetical protein
MDDFLSHYRQKYRDRGFGIPLEPSHRVLNDLAELLNRQPAPEIIALLDNFFSSDLGTIKRRGYSLEAFIDSTHLLRLFRWRVK